MSVTPRPRQILRLTGAQHALLRQHLLPGDGLEAVAVAMCGRMTAQDVSILTVHKILPIPNEVCEREHPRITWPTEFAMGLIEEAARKGMAILKIHSHPGPGYYNKFSEVDNQSDSELFPSLHAWTDDGLPHASAVILKDGRIFGRFISRDGDFTPIDRVAIAGDEILLFDSASGQRADSEVQVRTRQAFGEQTTSVLRSLRIGIVGCSGTGSWVIEQLARLGVGELVLVDPDRVEQKNLNRIVVTCAEDAIRGRLKVEAAEARIRSYGTGTQVITYPVSALTRDAADALAACDIVFGCVDSVSGRDLLNRLAVFYLIPYFDLGVQLRADGKGGIDTVCGSVHYLLPDGSSLLSRELYTPEMLTAEVLQRLDAERYAAELKAGYVLVQRE
jgi:proteasome lid subunit RPN8/RPN11